MDDEIAVSPAPRRRRASQDQILANGISQYRTALTLARTNPQLGGLLRLRGYDDAAFAIGLARCDAAQAAFNARQEADAAREAALAAKRAVRMAAHASFIDFRAVVRAFFRANPAARIALGAVGRVPEGLAEFVTFATAAYAAALEREDYLAVLSRCGLDRTALEAELARLDALIKANAAYQTAKAAVVRATAQRNAAARLLYNWWVEFGAVARVALKDRPDLLHELGL